MHERFATSCMGAQWVVTPFVQSVGMLSQGVLRVLDSNALISSFPEKFQNTPRISKSVLCQCSAFSQHSLQCGHMHTHMP